MLYFLAWEVSSRWPSTGGFPKRHFTLFLSMFSMSWRWCKDGDVLGDDFNIDRDTFSVTKDFHYVWWHLGSFCQLFHPYNFSECASSDIKWWWSPLRTFHTIFFLSHTFPSLLVWRASTITLKKCFMPRFHFISFFRRYGFKIFLGFSLEHLLLRGQNEDSSKGNVCATHDADEEKDLNNSCVCNVNETQIYDHDMMRVGIVVQEEKEVKEKLIQHLPYEKWKWQKRERNSLSESPKSFFSFQLFY